MAELTDSQTAPKLPLPIETWIDEKLLLDRTIKPILCTAFFSILICTIALTVASNRSLSVVDGLIRGLGGTICTSIGLGIPLFMGWGVSVFFGARLNSILGNPLNPSAIAALAGGVAFGIAHTFANVGLTLDPGWRDPTIWVNAVIAVFGSLLFQIVSRVRVARDIARHNARAGRKQYTEPPCHVRFQLRQVMIMMIVLSLFLALAMQIADGSLVLLVALWGLLTAATFYPAILISGWVDQRMGNVKLRPWEEARCEYAFPAAAVEADEVEVGPEVPTVTNASSSLEESYVSPARDLEPLPNYRETARFSANTAMSTAIKWISLAGGIFGLMLPVCLEISGVFNEEVFRFGGLFVSIPFAIGGLIFGLMLAGMVMAILWLINVLCGHLVRMGTLAALTGGLVGAVGSWFLLNGCEVVHYLPWNESLDFSKEANRFPLAFILLASLMGQTFGRIGVKKYGFQIGQTHQEYFAESTGPVASRYSLIALILSACAWVLFIGQNDPIQGLTMDGYFVMLALGAFACVLTVWPLANFLARIVRVAPKKSAKPNLALGMMRQAQV